MYRPLVAKLTGIIDMYKCNICKYVILEALTGFGKSPVAIAVALSLGSS
jgi:hypothetical protein